MKITIATSELSQLVNHILPFVERKTTIPILSNLFIQAREDHITITGTDLDCSLILTHECQVKEEGATTIPARKLAEILKKLPLQTGQAGKIELSVREGTKKEASDHWITLIADQLTVKIPGMNPSNFPSLEPFPVDEGKHKGSYPPSILGGLIQRTSYAISDEKSRYTLNGALLEFRADGLRMVATDGHRCAIADCSTTDKPAKLGKMLIPKGTLSKLSKLIKKEKHFLEIAQGESNHFFRSTSGEWTMISRALTGQFPNYEAIIPKDNRIRVTLPLVQTKEILSTIAAFADERPHGTKWELIAGKGLKLSASSTETGQAEQWISFAAEDDLQIGFNAGYVMDIFHASLANVEKKLQEQAQIRLDLKDGNLAALWTPPEENGWSTRVILVPLRA